MTEEDIRPKLIFDEYLRLTKIDTKVFLAIMSYANQFHVLLVGRLESCLLLKKILIMSYAQIVILYLCPLDL